MALELSILYRGPLASCNYDCSYCPFAKRVDSQEQLERDRKQLRRFVAWVEQSEGQRINVLFTPWGEALTRPWYRKAMTKLNRMQNVGRVAVQTNLSCSLGWLADCDLETVGLWCTYHPNEVSRERFLRQCSKLNELGVRYSVGVVGIKEHFDEIAAMRNALSPNVYLWVNAYKREADYYSAVDIERLVAIDPLFELNNRRHHSLGRNCRTGATVVSVDGDGDVRRCHFIPDVIGNIYDERFEPSLAATPCAAATCGCHIGYVHLESLDLYSVFGNGVLDRIPERPVTRDDAVRRLQADNKSLADEQSPAMVQVSITGL